MHRLALVAGNAEIAAELGSVLTHRCYNQSRFREAVELCKTTLETAPDYRIYHSLARSEATLGEVQAALQHYQQALQDCPAADSREKATIIHNMAGIYAQQGQVSQALELYQQSLAAEESIGNVQGKAAILANIAYLAGEQGDTKQQLQLNLQAAEALARIGAYPNLVTVLGNLGSSPSDEKIAYLSQALWLSLRLQISLTDMIHLIVALFQAVPQADPLESLLAATALFLCTTQGKAHPDLESLQDLSLRMLGAAAPEGTDSMEALQTWMAQEQLNDPNLFLPRLDRLLVEAIGDHWLFDPQQV